MRTTILLVWACCTVSAQPTPAPDPQRIETPWIDLSGTWRYMSGDDPRYAQPGFDDSAWRTVQVPLPRPATYQLGARGHFWLRRDVQLPESELSNVQALALTVGAVGEACEVYVNGVLVGTSGPFVRSELRLARPRTFDLPAGLKQAHLLLAVHAWQPALYGSNGFRIDDLGPWLLTGSKAAPRDAGDTAIAMRQLGRLGDLVQPVILICLALVVILIWLRDRSQRELFWLGLYLLVVAVGRIDIFFELTPGSRPFRASTLRTIAGLTVLPAALIAQITATALRIRWLTLCVWITALAGGAILLQTETFESYRWSLWSIEILTLMGLAWSWSRPGRAKHGWGAASHVFITMGILLVVWGHVSSYASSRRIPQLPTTVFAVRFSPQMTSITIMSLAMMISILRRLLQDRDERQRLAGEFEAARVLQRFLLRPPEAPAPGYEIQAVYQPAQEVGGDFYQVLSLSDGGQLLAVGDVSGKGLKAAMVVSLLTGALRNRRSDEPGALMRELNLALCRGLDGGFVTASLARFHPDGRLTIANAGNPAPYLGGEEVGLEAGLPLGVAREAEYSERELVLGQGQQMTFVSDGVVEASNARGELFGFERTREVSGKSAQEIADAARAWGQNDDITVVTVRRAA